MTPADFEFLRALLKRRSGLVLSVDKQYLLESRLLPVARKRGFDSLSALIGALKADKTELLVTAVVEAMTTNKSFFFATRCHSTIFAPQFFPHCRPRGGSHAHCAFGAPLPQAVRSLTRWRWR